ncbi:NAD(P)H-dependent oxidoreductase subunit E [Silvanigrella sp.]|jgi:NADH-quinone oxidoreductase subunit E|uniref:NADH-quinone oxidoreductase subunit NuoE family protein n=1 Tax=Silvanigrella sp. TaxID=2024976 RepID=UPI0037C5F694
MPYFSQELTKTIEGYLKRYETKRSSILPILHAVQDEKDWISDQDVDALEKEFELSAVDIREVLTFYTMYRQSPPKPYRFEICKSISCWLLGANETILAVRKEIEKAEKEGRQLPFEVHGVECLGQCGYAPSTLINKDRHNNVTPEKALALIKEYCSKELPKAAINCAANAKK